MVGLISEALMFVVMGFGLVYIVLCSAYVLDSFVRMATNDKYVIITKNPEKK